MSVPIRRVVGMLLSLPLLYAAVAYAYLAYWHGGPWLFNTLVHENGRLTLLGSLFYFDHFLGCLPMILLFALCAATGFAFAARLPAPASARRAGGLAVNLLLPIPLFIFITFLASTRIAGFPRTVEYALQWIERDGVLSPGGGWNQLQVSNIPIALGTISAGLVLASSWPATPGERSRVGLWAGLAGLALALALDLGLTALWWPGWEAFENPRWVAHSIREIATYPLTGIPIALAAIFCVHARLASGQDSRGSLRIRFPAISVILLAIGLAIVTGQLLYLRTANVLAMAQKPAFAPDGLSVAYLLASHVFEHFLDFVIIGPLSAGIYAVLLGCSLWLRGAAA